MKQVNVRRIFNGTWSRYAFICIFAATFISLKGQTQNTPPAPRDAQALTIVANAVTAMGGQAAFAAIKDVTSTGTCSPTQGAGGPPATQTFTWTIDGSQFRYETKSNGNDYVFVSGHGNPARSINGATRKASPESAREAKPYYLPGLVLAGEWSDAHYGFQFAGTKQLTSGSVIVVEIAPYYGTIRYGEELQTWYFDPASYEPVAVEYYIPGEQAPGIQAKATMTFGSFQRIANGLFPQQVVSQDPVSTSSCTITSTEINTAPPSALFDLSVGGNS